MNHRVKPGEIFVFGSNLAGRHGKGAALTAVRDHGAVYGIGVGPVGASFAIPTKDFDLKTLPLEAIRQHVDLFIEYASAHPETEFFVTALGTGLAGYSHSDIAPMFARAPNNCRLPPEWLPFVES